MRAYGELVFKTIIELELNMGTLNIHGLSDKDKSLVEQMERLCHSSFSVLFPKAHSLEVEIALQEWASETFDEKVDVFITRHLIEHLRDFEVFFEALMSMSSTNGLIIIEVPDSSDIFESGDLSQLWEEHTVYFTPETLRNVLEFVGLEIIREEVLTSEGEKLCFVIGRWSSRTKKKTMDQTVSGRHQSYFLEVLPKFLKLVQFELGNLGAKKDLWVFGANHSAGFFLDLVDTSFAFVKGLLDDDSQKIGKRLSKNGLEIRSAESIYDQNPVDILVAVNRGRAPELYKRLDIMFPIESGHNVRSLVEFLKSCWEKAK